MDRIETTGYEPQTSAMTRGEGADAREPYVHRSLTELEHELEGAVHLAQSLVERLRPVLTPDRPAAELAVPAEDKPPVPIAERVDSAASRVRALRALLGDALERLEV